LVKKMAPASRSRAAGGASSAAGESSVAAVPQRNGLALGRDIILDGHRHAVERSDRLTPSPALLGRARLGERPLRRQEVGGLNMRLEARDALQHVAHRLKRRQRAAAIGVEQRRRSCGMAAWHYQ